MVHNHLYEISLAYRLEVPGTFLLPREVAIAWFRCTVLNRGLLANLPLLRPPILISAIGQGLLLEWLAHWKMAPDVEDARKAFPSVGILQMQMNTREQSRFTHFVRFLVNNVYLGSLHLPQDDLFDTMCPICGDELTKIHIMCEYEGLQLERRRFLGSIHVTDTVGVVDFVN